ncbi:MAG: hypothetical protein QMD09_11145, partial [Desulfatibacillaceae bacterium]|nr:hypothetical protein [Desulfatibacillaceae bacterium]
MKSSLINFDSKQILLVSEALAVAEELVAQAYKLSAGRWGRYHYDLKTLSQLVPQEISHQHFAQIFRYQGRKSGASLTSDTFDFYKICLMDHVILDALDRNSTLSLFPAALYITCHELVHIVRFGRFLQAFETSQQARNQEEALVHAKTSEILAPANIKGLAPVMDF